MKKVAVLGDGGDLWRRSEKMGAADGMRRGAGLTVRAEAGREFDRELDGVVFQSGTSRAKSRPAIN